ncbi:neuroligin-1-like isoform X2 [Planococcus citri]
MDQIAALHWLQENVAYFGGDPTNVTVAGHGTGASCVNFLMSSTAVPEGLLFHRAILMSGSSLSPWALVKEPSMYAKQVAQSVNCSFQLPHLQLLKCLRDRPLHTLIGAKVQVPEFNTAFGPNVDGVVIDLVMNDMRKMPSDSAHVANVDSTHENVKWPFFGHFPLGDYASTMLNNPATKQKLISKYSRYDLMTGIVPAESFFIFTNEDVQYGIEPERRAKILKTFVKNTYRYHLSEILATVVNEYTEWERPIQHPINIRDETLEAISDAQYVAPVTQTADLHSSAHRNSYFYVFEYQSKYGDYQQRQGCIHGEELPYLFGAPLMNGLKHFPQNYTKSEISLSEAFMLYISNFARTGNPNDPGPNQESQRSTLPDRARLKNIEWTPYESVHKKYLSLDTKLKLKNHYRAHKLSFWLNLIPELHKPGSDDVPPSHHQFQPEEIMYPQQSFKVSSANTTNTVNKVIARNESFNSTFDLPVVMIASSSSDRNAMTPNDAAETVIHDEQLTSKENGFSNYSLALIITIGIGCVLLTFNVLVFIIVYHKKDNTRSNSDKNSGSIGSISSNNSLILGIEGGPHCSRKITENGGPSLNIKSTIDPSDRHRTKNETINTSMVDQSVMFVLEPLKQSDYDHQFKRRSEMPDLGCSSCSTLPKLSTHTSNKSTEVSPSYWSSKLNDDIHSARSPCELGLGTVPRQPKSILKHQSVNTEGLSKCSDDFSRIRV